MSASPVWRNNKTGGRYLVACHFALVKDYAEGEWLHFNGRSYLVTDPARRGEDVVLYVSQLDDTLCYARPTWMWPLKFTLEA